MNAAKNRYKQLLISVYEYQRNQACTWKFVSTFLGFIVGYSYKKCQLKCVLFLMFPQQDCPGPLKGPQLFSEACGSCWGWQPCPPLPVLLMGMRRPPVSCQHPLYSCVRPGREWCSGRGLPTVWAWKSVGLMPPNQEPNQSVSSKSPCPRPPGLGGHWPLPDRGCSEVSSGRGHALPCTRQSGMACGATGDPDSWMPIRATSQKSSFSRVHIQEADSGSVLVHLDRLTRAKRSTTRNRQACC